MVNLFDYTDFLKYFEDYYAGKKAEDPSFAYSTLARKAGFKNKGFAYNIFHGKKHLSPAHCGRISKALNHSRKEAGYFKTLVAFNQTVNLTRKRELFLRLSGIAAHGKGFTRAQVLAQDKYEYFSQWYHSAIRSLIGMYLFRDDYGWLAKKVSPRITPGKARKSVALLLRLGLVAVAPDGTLRLSDRGVTTGEEVAGLGLRNLYFECADLAKNAITTMDRTTRNITGLTLGISKATYREICADISEFQAKLMAKANRDLKADRVYQMNFYLFPLSKTKDTAKRWTKK